jgi:SAM-dependent methyltransferase
LKERAIEHYRCPDCGPSGLLVLRNAAAISNDEIMEAALECTACGKKHPVHNGIPRFVPEQSYTASFGFQWNRHRRTQLDSFTGLPISRDRLFAVSQWPRRMDGQRVLEAGSGAGRFTEVLIETGATLFSFDFSTAVDANFLNNGQAPNLHLSQSDILRVPFAAGSFDKVICLGVLQHTPHPEASFRSLARQVKPGGELVVDVYTRRLISLLQWKYLLRPITTRVDGDTLYRWIARLTPPLVPAAALLRRLLGRAGARLIPIVEYSHLGLAPEVNLEWAILDTFDMYSPTHDHPQSIATVSRWFKDAGFERISVGYGPNGVTGKGCRPTASLGA